MLFYEGLVEPSFVPVREITDDQLADYVRTTLTGTTPTLAVLHIPDGYNQHNESIEELTRQRIVAVEQARPGLQLSEEVNFKPSDYDETRQYTDIGLHFDGLSSLVAHATFAGSCDAYFLPDKPVPGLTKIQAMARITQNAPRIIDAWMCDHRVDPQLTEPTVYHTQLNIGSFVLFSIGNKLQDPSEPLGYWHDFISTTSNRASRSYVYST